MRPRAAGSDRALPAAGFALRPGGRAVLAAVVLLAAGCAPGPRDGTPGTDSAVLEAGSAAATASATAAGGSMPDAAAPAGADLLGRPPVEHRQWTKQFDPHFRKYAKRFFGIGLDWRWFKAQGIAESGLRENAESWVGAKGIMQIMPATLQEIAAKSSLQVLDGSDPGQNIAAGVFYDRHLYDLWDDVPDAGERLGVHLRQLQRRAQPDAARAGTLHCRLRHLGPGRPLRARRDQRLRGPDPDPHGPRAG